MVNITGGPGPEGDNLSEVELVRLRSLFRLDLSGDGPDERFDRFTRIARRAFDVPVALLTLIDDEYQWFCASSGMDFDGTHRSESFCTNLISGTVPMLVVEDARADDRFSDLVLVTGDEHIRFYAGATVSSAGGERVGSLCVLDVEPRTFDDSDRTTLRDLADLVESELQNIALATTDELTGLGNRRAFDATARRFLRLAQRRSEPFTVLIADVDGLKNANDTHGHGLGDKLLGQAATVLTNCVRPWDLVARVGGDEFAVVAYGLDSNGAQEMIGAVQAATDNLTSDSTSTYPLSISLGSATSTRGETLEEVVQRADGEMYDDKRDRTGSGKSPG